jgi:hypothetical protein
MSESKPNNPEDTHEVSSAEQSAEVLDPNDADRLRNQIRGQTLEHAVPPRLEDEGQSGG